MFDTFDTLGYIDDSGEYDSAITMEPDDLDIFVISELLKLRKNNEDQINVHNSKVERSTRKNIYSWTSCTQCSIAHFFWINIAKLDGSESLTEFLHEYRNVQMWRDDLTNTVVEPMEGLLNWAIEIMVSDFLCYAEEYSLVKFVQRLVLMQMREEKYPCKTLSPDFDADESKRNRLAHWIWLNKGKLAKSVNDIRLFLEPFWLADDPKDVLYYSLRLCHPIKKAL